jgi:hypothetical protein
MYDKVQRYWQEETKRVRALVEQLPPDSAARSSSTEAAALLEPDDDLDAAARLRRQLHILTTTEMAVIVSPAQNEIDDMAALGLDIEPHRRRLTTPIRRWMLASKTPAIPCGWCLCAPCGSPALMRPPARRCISTSRCAITP